MSHPAAPDAEPSPSTPPDDGSGTPAGRPALSPLAAYLGVAAHFGLFVFLADRLALESRAFREVLVLAFGGFLVQGLLPERLRVGFFVVLSLAGFSLVLGAGPGGLDLVAGALRTGVLLGLALTLVGLCRLPISWRVRLALLGAVGAGAIALRAGLPGLAATDPLWPVLGSVFMFRSILFVYDRRHEAAPDSLADALAYFFLLPNVCFPLFPVVDYKAFRRGRARHDVHATRQRGLHWMFRGAVQLLLWRLVYYHVYVDPTRVASGTDLAFYLLGNVALYLRVSGQFHVVIGLLLLFGWNLPETNRRYFLATSFSDYWRRVNIYWKDFILKVFYYPALFRWKARGEAPAVVAATLFAFAMTWLLHGYQWFWLRGEFVLRAQDTVFWGVLALLVTWSSLRELRRGRTRSLRPRARGWQESAAAGARASGTFVALTLLWSLWSADSLRQWLGLSQFADASTLGWLAAAAGAVALATIVLEAPPRWLAEWTRPASRPQLLPSGAALAATALLVAGWQVSSWRAVERLPFALGLVAQSLRETRPNKADEEYLVRGYYENLMDPGRIGALAGGVPMPAGWEGLQTKQGQVPVRDLRNRALVPGLDVEINGHRLTTNAFGMRDRAYSEAKPPGVIRIALLGSSVVMGWGVADGETFEAVLEERLGRELAPTTGRRYELLNFAMNGYSPLAQVEVMQRAVARFRPDAVVLFGHTQDPLFSMNELSRSLRDGAELPPAIAELARRARVDAHTPERQAERRLAPHWRAMLQWAFGEVAAQARRAGAQPVYVFLPDPVRPQSMPRDRELEQLAREAGFAVLALGDVFGDVEWLSLVVAPWDHHPNARAHAQIADALFAALEREDPLRLRTP